jgi:hypothetical protein
MAILSNRMRAKLPKSDFGLPGARKYPMPDASHAANAKARATQQEERGNLSSSQKAAIFAKANRKLGE